MKKKISGSGEKESGGFIHLAAVESEILKAFPNVIAHLAVTKYEDGDPRVPGEIHLKTQGPSWFARLKDTDSAQFIPVSAPSVDELLLMMDLLLADEKAPWQADQYAARKKKK